MKNPLLKSPLLNVGGKYKFHRRFNIFNPARIIFLSFALLIVTGTFLLMLPAASSKEPLTFVDAFFTATSATCVTGLIVVDTGIAFTQFGQIVILGLIQIGGLGFMTFSTFFVYLISGRFSITGKELLEEAFSQDPIADISRLVKIVLIFTAVTELIGWLLLTAGFSQIMPLGEAAYTGLFHSVSAFCNAGFSTFSTSFEGYYSNPLIMLTIGGLIIMGGLGFIVVYDVFTKRRKLFHKKRFDILNFHTRVVLVTTAALIITGALIFFLLEYSNSLGNMQWGDKFLTSLFQSITTRTAGFNSVDIHHLTNSTLLIFILLMFIGASPGSCGGGIKNTTFTILMVSILSRFKLREDVNIFYRRIPNATVSRVFSVAFFSIVTILFFTILILIVELPEVSHTQTRGLFLEYLFEVVSAFGTVGLSTGITPTLSSAGKILITLLMFIGRLGPLTVALAVRGRETPVKYKYMQEKIMIG